MNEIEVKYFDGQDKPLVKTEKGNWVDVYANETVFIPFGENKLVHLGFALNMPDGYEGHLLPRSSTFKTWGVILANQMGIIDTTYRGDKDEWCMNLLCEAIRDTQTFTTVIDGFEQTITVEGTTIHKGDKIGQMQIVKSMPDEILFNAVDELSDSNRGGFGTTGTN